jgi:CTD small phosphatase-like protein 2
VFDLDETLVHCSENLVAADIVLPITFPTGEEVRAGLNIRPFVLDCLTAASSMFEVAVFTASHQCYADTVLDYLDPNQTLIHHRLYRENCVMVDGIYMKDLRIFTNWDLPNIIIVDNAAYSFGY